MQEKCCPQGSWPALQVSYYSKGKTFHLGEIAVYQIGSSNKTLVIFSDIYGASSGRHHSVADTFAQFGYTVFIPQVLIKPYQGSGDIMQCIKNQTWQQVQSRFKAFHHFLIDSGRKQFYAIGFCWGVWAGFKFASKYQGFKGFVGYHPSLTLCKFSNQDQSALVQSIKCPAYFCPASNDPSNVKQGGELVEILKKKFGANRVGTHQFKEQTHGWVVRGDVSKPLVHRDVLQALKIGREYFAKL